MGLRYGTRDENLPITTSWMCKIRTHYLANLVPLGHYGAILPYCDDKLKPPESILGQTKSPAHRWPVGIAQETEVSRKEEIVNFFRGVSEIP